MEVEPRHVICVLSKDQDSIRSICTKFEGFEYDEEYSQNEPFEGMKAAFESSEDRIIPSFTDKDWKAIKQHTAVNYVLSPHMEKGNEAIISGQALAFISEAFRNGALAVKGESSGIAHGKERWLELYENSKVEDDFLYSIFRAWVRYPIVDLNKQYSVGMHLLGMKDVEIEAGDRYFNDLDMFLIFLVIDRAEQRLKPGHTFSKDSDSKRYRIESVKCNRYEPDDFFYNGNGLWSLVECV